MEGAQSQLWVLMTAYTADSVLLWLACLYAPIRLYEQIHYQFTGVSSVIFHRVNGGASARRLGGEGGKGHLKLILSMQRLYLRLRHKVKRRKYCGEPVPPPPPVPPPMHRVGENRLRRLRCLRRPMPVFRKCLIPHVFLTSRGSRNRSVKTLSKFGGSCSPCVCFTL